MSKKYYVSSGDLNEEVEAESPLEACTTVIKNSNPGDNLGLIIKVSDKGFNGDLNPWFVATETVIRAAGHTLTR